MLHFLQLNLLGTGLLFALGLQFRGQTKLSHNNAVIWFHDPEQNKLCSSSLNMIDMIVIIMIMLVELITQWVIKNNEMKIHRNMQTNKI